MDLKLNFYKQLGSIVKPEAVFASNTSSLPITNMGLASGRPERFVGLHFFNPVPVMNLVEIIRALQTSNETEQATRELSKTFSKETSTSNDVPGKQKKD